MSEYNVILSWSGKQSNDIASAIYAWLPNILPEVRPWISSEDIPVGSPWFGELSLQLQSHRIIVACITPENAKAPWLYYEAGAIAAKLKNSLVCPLLIGVKPSDLQNTPFAQQQCADFSERGMFKLIKTINTGLSLPHHESHLKHTHAALWQGLKDKIDKAILDHPSPLPSTTPTTTKTPTLSSEAQLILIEGAQDQYGVVLTTESFEGFGMTTNNKSLINQQDAPTVARFKRGVQQLVDAGYAKQSGKDGYELTTEGHEAATAMHQSTLEGKLAEVTRERDEWRKKANETQTPVGKIKDYLHQLGLRGKNATNKDKDEWWWSLPSIMKRAVYSRKYNLFMETYNRNAYAECADMLVHSMNFADNDINTDFKPEHQVAVAVHAEIIGLYQRLKDRLEEWPKALPMSGTNQTLPKMELDFATKMKTDLSALLVRARDEANKGGLGAYFKSSCDAVQSLNPPEYHALLKVATHQKDAFEAVLKKL